MPEINEQQDIEIRSEEVQEILSHVPNRIVRWGIMTTFFIVLLIIAGSFYIKYPEIITANVNVTTENPPIRLVTQAAGKIKIIKTEKSKVSKNTYIAVIENSAVTSDVISVNKILTEQFSLLTKDSVDLVKVNTDDTLKLGDLQNDYASLKQNYLNLNYFLSDNYFEQKSNAVQSQYDHYKKLNEKQFLQKEILEKQVAIAEKKYNIDKDLRKQGVIADAELARSESDFLQVKYTFKSAEMSLVNNEIQLDEYKKTLLDLNQQFLEKKRQLVLSLQESYKKMLSSISNWEQRYVLKSSIEGVISYSKPYADGQFVTAGEEVLTVVPVENNIVAKATIPPMGSGKVQPGQRVNIKVDNYPFKEFGIIEGKVESIALVPSKEGYLVTITLPKGMETNYHKKLIFKQEMSGTVEIVTKDLRLSERIFFQIRELLHKR